MSAQKGLGAAGYITSLADRRSIVTASVAAGAVIGVVAVVVGLWRAIGNVQISTAGWVAMVLGVLATLALGTGLMALVFISSRRGYDEPVTVEVEPNTRSLHEEAPSAPDAAENKTGRFAQHRSFGTALDGD